ALRHLGPRAGRAPRMRSEETAVTGPPPSEAAGRRRAAAVVPRLPDGRVLVGVRTHHARSWPGTVAFPGGATEPDDRRLPLATGVEDAHDALERACALRELAEE